MDIQVLYITFNQEKKELIYYMTLHQCYIVLTKQFCSKSAILKKNQTIELQCVISIIDYKQDYL